MSLFILQLSQKTYMLKIYVSEILSLPFGLFFQSSKLFSLKNLKYQICESYTAAKRERQYTDDWQVRVASIQAIGTETV